MASKFEKILSESLGLPQEAKVQIQEAWNEQLSEAKDRISAELREEFASKFEHDKNTLVESIDRFLEDKVKQEISEFAQDKRDLAAERVKYKTAIKEHIGVLDKFLMSKVAEEIQELHKDRVKMKESVTNLEGFLVTQLSEEIKEFHNDKKELVNQRVKMIKEGKQALVETKRGFITKAAKLIEENINSVLRNEISQYRDDIVAARENDFGRRIFESFVAEYMTSYLNEGSEVKKMQKAVSLKEKEIKVLESKVQEKQALTESANKKLAVANDMVARSAVMGELLAPLSKDKKEIMKDLLGTVKTQNLRESFNKYLPAVLNESVAPKKATLVESKNTEKTGDRAHSVAQTETNANAYDLAEIRRLAGIK
jgi:hypothetical protein